jgi:hypothetical protein
MSFTIVICEEKLEETNQVQGQVVWDHGANLIGYERPSPQQAPSHAGNGFFHPLVDDAAAEPTLQIGYVCMMLFVVIQVYC